MTMHSSRREDLHNLQAFGLRVLSRFGELDEEENQKVRAMLANIQRYPAGHEIILEGAPLNQSYLLLDGWAACQRVLGDGRRQIFSFALPGDGLGLCARRDGLSLHTTLALTPVALVPMPLLNQGLQGAKGGLSEIAWEMLTLEESLLVNQVLRLGRQSAYERLIHLLLELYDRLADTGSEEDGTFVLPLTQEVLSDALGLSTVHTNRVLQQLRRDGSIDSRGTAVRLRNRARLTKIADYRSPPWSAQLERAP